MHELLESLRFGLALDETIDAETPLISSGLIDSFGMVALVTVLESEYGVAFEPEEIDVSTFDTPRQILQRISEVGAAR